MVCNDTGEAVEKLAELPHSCYVSGAWHVRFLPVPVCMLTSAKFLPHRALGIYDPPKRPESA
jgi:hypothetical protein